MVREDLEFLNPEAIYAEGFDEALIGHTICHVGIRAVYDADKCIEILCKDMDFDDAAEHFDYNIVGSYVGDNGPIFMKVF